MPLLAASKTFSSQSCGDEGVRTPDLVVANHALSQLSYIPQCKKQSQISSPFDGQTAEKIPDLFLYWAYLDSNQGPQLYQSCALAN